MVLTRKKLYIGLVHKARITQVMKWPTEVEKREKHERSWTENRKFNVLQVDSSMSVITKKKVLRTASFLVVRSETVAGDLQWFISA